MPRRLGAIQASHPMVGLLVQEAINAVTQLTVAKMDAAIRARAEAEKDRFEPRIQSIADDVFGATDDEGVTRLQQYANLVEDALKAANRGEHVTPERIEAMIEADAEVIRRRFEMVANSTH